MLSGVVLEAGGKHLRSVTPHPGNHFGEDILAQHYRELPRRSQAQLPKNKPAAPSDPLRPST